jgi:(p)ppGpp synthase/HD superfamily hydrolase
MSLSSRFEETLVYATRLHQRQVRKVTRTPYIGHLLGVAALVLEDGGDEDEAIAALLHDAVEDQGGMKKLEQIRERFGERVARIVDGCTDSYDTPKRPWLERKQAYLVRLNDAPDEVFRVCLADKLYNLRTLLAELRKNGELTWTKFNGGKEGTLWYYRALLPVFKHRCRGYLLDEYERALGDIYKMSG